MYKGRTAENNIVYSKSELKMTEYNILELNNTKIFPKATLTNFWREISTSSYKMSTKSKGATLLLLPLHQGNSFLK